MEDLPDQFRSQVQSINLLAIAHSDSLKVWKIFSFYLLDFASLYAKDPEKSKRFFKPIVNDINVLQEQGLTINGIHVSFSFSNMSADNLAAHQIGGFQTSFSSNYFCRRCHLSYADRTLSYSSSNTTWRTTVGHDNILQQILIDPVNRP